METILRQVRAGDLLQLALVPDTRYQYEFPFISTMPAFLEIPDNPWLNSIVFEIASRQLQLPEAEHLSPYLKPFHAVEMIDPRLSNIIASQWTSVTSNDQLVQRLLQAYFAGVYPTEPAFQKDYFLADMIAGRREFCSSSLINAVLAYATVRLDNPK